MRTVCITGHRPDGFLISKYSFDTVKRIVDDVAFILKKEYGDELEFCLGGACGVDLWMGAAAIDHNIKYKLFLPFLPQIQSKYWSNENKNELDRQLKHAMKIIIPEPSNEYDYKKYYERDCIMVDNSDFVVSFWAGKRRGGTFDTMKYALNKSKFVFNALDSFRPIFKHDLEIGWTPPHLIKG